MDLPWACLSVADNCIPVLWTVTGYSYFLFAEFFIENPSKPLCPALASLGEFAVKSFCLSLIYKEYKLLLFFTEFSEIFSAALSSHLLTSLLLTTIIYCC